MDMASDYESGDSRLAESIILFSMISLNFLMNSRFIPSTLYYSKVAPSDPIDKAYYLKVAPSGPMNKDSRFEHSTGRLFFFIN